MEIVSFIDIGTKKYEYEKIKDNKWARGAYIELSEQMQILLSLKDKESNDYTMQLGVVRYILKNMELYLTLKKVS